MPRTWRSCRRRISTDCRWRSISCRRTILPYLATRGCYWGRCEFCDHGEGYTAGYRSKKIQDVLAEIKYLRDKYGVQAFSLHR